MWVCLEGLSGPCHYPSLTCFPAPCSLQHHWDSTSPGMLTGRSCTWASQLACPCSMCTPFGTSLRRCPASAWAHTSTAAPTAHGCMRTTGSSSRRTRAFSTLTGAWTPTPGRSSACAVREQPRPTLPDPRSHRGSRVASPLTLLCKSGRDKRMLACLCVQPAGISLGASDDSCAF